MHRCVAMSRHLLAVSRYVSIVLSDTAVRVVAREQWTVLVSVGASDTLRLLPFQR